MKITYLTTITVLLLTSCSKTVRPQQLLADLKELSSDKYEGRKTGTEGNKRAADYIVARFKELKMQPYQASYQQPFSFKKGTSNVSGTNVIAYIPGKSEEVIVISAHYDHLGKSNGKIYNGADDNASGVAALLAIAKHFSNKQPEHTLVFAAFDAEESGLKGSQAFVENPPVPLSKIKLNINLDMVARADKGELYACGSYHYPELKKYLISSNAKLKLLTGHDDPKLGHDDWTNQSDHFAFHQKKIPFIYFGVEDHADYHQASDKYEKIDKDTFQNTVDIILNIVSNIDKGISIHSIFREKVRM